MSTATVDDFTADSNGTPATIQDAPEVGTVAGAESPQTPASSSPEAPSTSDALSAPDEGVEAEEPPPSDTPEPTRDAQGRFSKPSSLQKRINEATAKQRAAERIAAEREREAAYWRDLAQKSSAPQRSEAGSAGTPTAPQADAEPTFEQFSSEPDPWLAYTRALARYEARQLVRAEREAERRSQYQQTVQARIAKFNRDLEGLRATTPDFDSAVEVLKNTPASEELSQAILDAENPALVALHLARHADEFDHVRTLTGPSLYRALGRLESRLAVATNGPTPQAAAVTRANPPIKPLGSSPVVSDSPPTDASSDDAHFEYWNRKEREARRR